MGKPQIVSGTSSDLLTIDPTSKAARATRYYKSTTEELFKPASYIGYAVTAAIVGTAATPQNLFSLENQTGSGVIARILSLRFYVDDQNTSLTAVACQVNFSRATGMPSDGITLLKKPHDFTKDSSALVVARNGPTATAGSFISRNFNSRNHTLVGQGQQTYPIELMPYIRRERDGLFLKENTAVLLQITGTASSNNTGYNYLVQCKWQETAA